MRSLVVLLLAAAPAAAQTFTISGGKADAANVVVKVRVPPGKQKNNTFQVTGEDVQGSAHVAPPGLFDAAGDPGDKYFTFLLPAVPAGAKYEAKTDYNAGPMSTDLAQAAMYRFEETAGEHVDLVLNGKKLVRFVNAPRDAKNHYLTFKPFHHVFAPDDGNALITGGAHPNTKEFQFPHHRGLFFGFNKITYGDGKKTADIWHGTDNVYSTCDAVPEKVDHNFAFARHRADISWHGADGNTFATEAREVTVFRAKDGLLIDWNTLLRTTLPKVRLDGDPQHAGFHFRAAQDVSKNGKENTYYLRPDGPGKPGETRNWDAKGKDPKAVNLPWNAVCFVTSGKRYTVLRVPHPENPKETRGSEREYGRFGDYFEYDLTPATPLKLRYRLWVQAGEMTRPQCEAIAAGFAAPPAATLNP